MKKIIFIVLLAVLLLTFISCGHEHSYGEWTIEREATCTESGNRIRACECGEKENETILPSGHTSSEWITDKAATCKEAGTKHKECTECEEVIETGTIDKLTTHTPGAAVTENYVDSDCETAGSYNSVVYCTVCGEKLSSEAKVVEKKAHTPSEWITDKAATCKESGTKHKECTECEKVLETGTIDKLTTHTPVTDSRVEPTFTTTGLTEGSHCGVCGEVLVAQDTIPMIPSKTTLTASSLTVDGRSISGSFSYATDIFSFVNDIAVTNNSPWVVSIDSFGMQTVATKIVPLREGNNTFYIHVTNPDQTVSTYTVNIYRNHLYTVSFDAKGGTSVSAQYVEEGDLAEVPTTTRAGYTFVSWNYDFQVPITSDVKISASWNAKTNTPYKVQYYLQNVDKNGYDLVETEELFGKTDTTASTDRTYEHFTLNSTMSNTSGNINGDGSLVLKVFYKRNSYTVTTSVNNAKAGAVTSGGTYAYDKEITLTATTNPGYTFLGWFDGETKVCGALEYTFNVDSTETYIAKWSVDDTAYKVEYYLENLDKTDYELVETEELFGKTDTTASTDRTYEHFTLNSTMSNTSGNINGDGSLVLKVYYKRDMYTISANINHASINGAGSYAYGNSIIACVEAVNIGYVFVGWYSGDELVSEETEYKTEIDKNIEARFGVVPEMQNFEFESTLTTCFITGVKDKLVTEIVILDNEIKIADGAFAGCVSLKDLTLPYLEGSLGRIFGTSNYGLTEETYKQSVSGSNISYTIPSSLENVTVLSGTIGYQALNSLNIKTITLGGNVKGISCGSSAGGPSIYMTPYLEEFIVDENNPYYKSIDGNLYTKDGETFLQYARGKNETIFVIPEGVKRIEDTACAYYCKFKTIVIPNTVTTICNEAFTSCSAKFLYEGTRNQWEEISIINGYWGGNDITFSPYYYAENIPSDYGKYWRYVDGIPTIW